MSLKVIDYNTSKPTSESSSLKICKRCNKDKKPIAFPKPNSEVCSMCKASVNIEKEKAFLEKEDLGIEALDENKRIKILAKYARPCRVVRYEKAIDIAFNYNCKVLDDETLYLLEFWQVEKEDLPTRFNVLERDDYECFYCGIDADTVDHVIPKAKGGLFTEQNLVTSCALCNNAKSDRDLTREEVSIEAEKLKKVQLEKAAKKKKSMIQNKMELPVFSIKDSEPTKPSLEDMIKSTLSPKKQKWE